MGSSFVFKTRSFSWVVSLIRYSIKRYVFYICSCIVYRYFKVVSIFFCARKADLRCDGAVTIHNTRSKGAPGANQQKMIRGNHDFPPQVLRPPPYDNSRFTARGGMPAAKIRRIFLQLPGGLFEIKIFKMFDSAMI